MKPLYVVICCSETCVQAEVEKLVAAQNGQPYMFRVSSRTLETEDRITRFYTVTGLNTFPEQLHGLNIQEYTTCGNTRGLDPIARQILRSRVRPL